MKKQKEKKNRQTDRQRQKDKQAGKRQKQHLTKQRKKNNTVMGIKTNEYNKENHNNTIP